MAGDPSRPAPGVRRSPSKAPRVAACSPARDPACLSHGPTIPCVRPLAHLGPSDGGSTRRNIPGHAAMVSKPPGLRSPLGEGVVGVVGQLLVPAGAQSEDHRVGACQRVPLPPRRACSCVP